MRQRHSPELPGDAAHFGNPIGCRGIDRQFGEHRFRDTVEYCGLVRHVPVDHHRVTTHRLGQTSHRQPVDPVAVDDHERRIQYSCPSHRAVPAAGPGFPAAARGFSNHEGAPFSGGGFPICRSTT
jgi:hypothetical protein